MKRLSGIFYSFPVQLLVLHAKKHHFLLLFWVFLALLVTSTTGQHYGINYLYLDPEYLGEVDFLSFLLIGAALGAFTMTWNITSYILHAHRFPFLATLHRPFGVFMLNNSLIPTAFLLLYGVEVVDFQRRAEFTNWLEISSQVMGLLLGLMVAIFMGGTYFFQTNKDIWQTLGLRREDDPVDVEMQEPATPRKHLFPLWRVDTYFSMGLRPRIVRSVDHYDPALIQRIYRQHHGNAVFIEVTGLVLLAGLGLGIDYPFFRAPAGASVLILFGLLLALTGAFSYWIRGWRAAMYVLLILALNGLMQQELFSYRNAAFGMDYDAPAAIYSLERLDSLSQPAQRQEDRQHWEQMLNNWAAKNERPSGEKPTLVLLNASGGGLRAGLFATCVLQTADSLIGGDLMDQSFLMAGASGGMLGLAWYRELTRPGVSELPHPWRAEARQAMANDILNPVFFTIVVNDLFFPWQHFDVAGRRYRKDRAYIFERILNEYTQGSLNHAIINDADAEYRQDIPAMVISPTIINDERRLFISPQPVSWLCRPANLSNALAEPQIDGIDFRSFFAQQGADSLPLATALRMNATFPYILPNVALPTKPLTEVMDAGLRDNFGVATSTRFIHNFRDWLRENTAGVVIIEIRGHEQFEAIADYTGQTFLEKVFKPVGNLISNWSEIQDYEHDFLIDFAAEALDGKLEVLVFEYTPGEDAEKASVSLHLTRSERHDIESAVGTPHNRESFAGLMEALGQAETR